MSITRCNAEQSESSGGAHDELCPYIAPQSIFCSASVMAMAADNRRKARYCGSEDYDHCPLFLAKQLRKR